MLVAFDRTQDVVQMKPSKLLPAKRRRSTLDDIFGPVQLLPFENPSTWAAWLQSIGAEMKPANVLDDILVRDLAENGWQKQRLRRLQVLLLICGSHAGVLELLKPRYSLSLDEMEQAQSLADGWRKGANHAVKEVEVLLATAGLTRDAVYAATLAERIEAFERIERMIANLEERCAATQREFVRRRSIQVGLPKGMLLESPGRSETSPETAPGNGNSSD
jgi:hypothetical protein